MSCVTRTPYTRISIAFSTDNLGITIVINNDGPEVGTKDHEKIFEPF